MLVGDQGQETPENPECMTQRNGKRGIWVLIFVLPLVAGSPHHSEPPLPYPQVRVTGCPPLGKLRQRTTACKAVSPGPSCPHFSLQTAKSSTCFSYPDLNLRLPHPQPQTARAAPHPATPLQTHLALPKVLGPRSPPQALGRSQHGNTRQIVGTGQGTGVQELSPETGCSLTSPKPPFPSTRYCLKVFLVIGCLKKSKNHGVKMHNHMQQTAAASDSGGARHSSMPRGPQK